jgi:ribokinase
MSTSSAGRVVVVGSVNVDLVIRLPQLPGPGETVTGGTIARHGGGKGANQAVAAARAGAQVCLIGAVGAADSADTVAELTAEGVSTAGLLRTTAPTGLAAVLVDAGTGENQIAVASGANAEVTLEHTETALAELRLTPADIVVPSFELPAAPLRAAARQAAAAGARLLVNPAPARDGYDGLLDGAIATPNAHELLALAARFGIIDQGDRAVTATALSARTGGPVIVTIGADGALVASGDACDHVPGLVVEVVDTTGAGDTVTGVLAASLAAGLPLRAGVRRAVAAGALAVTRPGARAGMPFAAAIDGLLGADLG